MRQKHTKVKGFIETIRERKSNGETNREIIAGLGLALKQVKQLINRESRRERRLPRAMFHALKAVLANHRKALKCSRRTSW